MPTNNERSETALRTVDHFSSLNNSEGEPLDTNMVDLLTNMMHLAKKRKLQFNTLIRQAKFNFDAEK